MRARSCSDAGQLRLGRRADGKLFGSAAAHQHAAFRKVDGLSAELAAALAQYDGEVAGQAVVTAAVADLGLAQERDKAGLQLGGKIGGILAGAVDRRAALLRTGGRRLISAALPVTDVTKREASAACATIRRSWRSALRSRSRSPRTPAGSPRSPP